MAHETVLVGNMFFKGHSSFPADSLGYGSHLSEIKQKNIFIRLFFTKLKRKLILASY